VDFSLILFIALVVTGIIVLLDHFILAPRRRLTTVSSENIGGNTEQNEAYSDRNMPLYVEYAKAFFPVILLVFTLRSFVIEPFRIPSGSMYPTLNIGDFILVNKFHYGIRLPVINTKIIGISNPERGEVMVFKYPHDPKINFIKRVIGIPGDVISYENKKLFINNKPVSFEYEGTYMLPRDNGSRTETDQYAEMLSGNSHFVINDPGVISRGTRGREIRVPEGNYFVMGDNRDHSNDSRFWGFVPEENIVGRAFFIWFSWDSVNGGGVNFKRIGNSIH
jgi:signal peptidase I